MKPLSPSLPHIIAMVGAPGSGKTQFAVEFAKIFNAPVVSSRQFEVFTDDTKTTSDATLAILEEFLKTKQTIILDGATDQRNNRMRISRLAREYGYKALFVWVQTDSVTAKRRWIKVYNGNDDSFDRRLKQFSAPHSSESYIVISGRHTFSTQARTVLKQLSASRPETPRRAVTNRISIG